MEPLFAAALEAALPCLDGARAKLGTLRALFEPCQSVLLYDESSCRPAKVAAALSALSRADGGRILRAALALPYNVPLGRVALHVVEVLHYGGDVVDLIDAMADPSLSCRVMRSVVNPIELVPLGAHKVTPGSPGSTRLVLLAAKLKLAAVRPQVEALLLGGGRADIGPQLGSAALAELEGFATAHEILDGVGIR